MIELVNPKFNKKLNLEMKFNGVSRMTWVEHQKTNYLFKDNLNNPKTNFGEVLYSSLCKKLEIDCVQTHLAYFYKNAPYCFNNEGVLVKSFLNDDVIFVLNYGDMIKLNNLKNRLCDYICVDDCIKNIKTYTDNIRYDINIEKTRTELYKRAIVDFFLAQQDRHCDNFEFLVYNNKIELAPMFDNGMSLSFFYDKEDNKLIIKNINSFYEGRYISCHYKMYLNGKFIKSENNFEDSEFCDIFTNQLVLLCEENEEIKTFVGKILKINITAEIKKVETEQDYVLPDLYKLSAQKIFKRRVNLFKLNYKKSQNHKKNNAVKELT